MEENRDECRSDGCEHVQAQPQQRRESATPARRLRQPSLRTTRRLRLPGVGWGGQPSNRDKCRYQTVASKFRQNHSNVVSQHLLRGDCGDCNRHEGASGGDGCSGLLGGYGLA